MMPRGILTLGGALVATTVWAGVAHAEPAPASSNARGASPAVAPADAKAARKLFDVAKARYDASDYAGALVQFHEANRLEPSPQVQRFIGFCLDRLGKLAPALEAYESFLASAPASMQKEVDETAARVAVLKAIPGKVRVETTLLGGMVSVDGRDVGPLPQEDLELSPGKHEVRITIAGYPPIVRELDVPHVAKITLRVPLAAPEMASPAPVEPEPPAHADDAPPASAARPPARPSKVPMYVAGAVALAATGVGATFGLMALGHKSDFDKNPNAASASGAESAAIIADVAFGIGLAAAVTTAVMFFNEGKGGEGKASEHAERGGAVRVSASPVVTPHGAGIGAFFRF
ncbi:PEGA domain-containing protein [Labilithrix luteola]|nr:PEGA domain-containing protein [Labilithrix luteola]